MIDTLVIVVFNRLTNLRIWFNILKQCKRPKNVVVIHNYDRPQPEFKKLCDDNEAIYIRRRNRGFDIGAFQDVCLNRLPGFPQWQQLLWCTDDTFPMNKDFIDQFALKDNQGVRCMEISPYVIEHIRTTGFAISKQVAVKLKFPANPILTKQHCYFFEHRGGDSTFMEQVKRMNLTVEMVAPKEISPLFDTGYNRRLDREKEFKELWGIDIPNKIENKPSGKITVICPIYNSFPEIISSMICQTYKNWELLLIHDGPNNTGLKSLISVIGDDRIRYIETQENKGKWGHYIRQDYIQKAEGDYILITNSDNHHVPVYFERMLGGFVNGTVATYCDSMVHNYKNWEVIKCSLKRGFVDCAGVMVKADAAKKVGWRNITDHSADWIYFSDLINKFGINSFKRINGCLLIHN